jgi:SAM-dependent methyltransferase
MSLQPARSSISALGARAVGRIFHRAELAPPHGVGRTIASLNQHLFERGLVPPWVWAQDTCQAYWRTQNQRDSPNHPSTYAAKPTEIVDFLSDFWSLEVQRESSILELGCNAGANLNRLRELGYTNLSGIEINPAAVEQMQQSFPALAQTATVSIGNLEEVLPARETSSVDVIFTMAVLLHLHPSSQRVFAEMVRVARKCICVIEAETTTLEYIFARNYRRIFQRLGCPQLRSVMITEAAWPHVSSQYFGYTARLFRVAS